MSKSKQRGTFYHLLFPLFKPFLLKQTTQLHHCLHLLWDWCFNPELTEESSVCVLGTDAYCCCLRHTTLTTKASTHFQAQPSKSQSRPRDGVDFCRPMCYKKCARESSVKKLTTCFFHSLNVIVDSSRYPLTSFTKATCVRALPLEANTTTTALIVQYLL